MLDLADRAYHDTVIETADRLGLLHDLLAKLTWLEGHTGERPSRCVLTPAPDLYGYELAVFEQVHGAWKPVCTGILALDPTAPRYTVTITAVHNPILGVLPRAA